MQLVHSSLDYAGVEITLAYTSGPVMLQMRAKQDEASETRQVMSNYQYFNMLFTSLCLSYAC